jgi:hypothetical protein
LQDFDMTRQHDPATTDDRILAARQARRRAAEDRFLSRQERRSREAEALVGEICRDGQPVFYVNRRDRKGNLTGKVAEFPGRLGFGAAIGFLIQNNYV